MPAYDLYEIIRDMIHTEMTYYKHYIGKVMSNTDPDKEGKVLITIPELEWDNNIQIWASPRMGNSMSLPKVNAYVEVYFMNGDSARPVYLHGCTEMTGQVPSQFNGIPSTNLLFQNPMMSTSYLKEQNGTYDMKGVKVNLLNATDKFVLGDKLDTWITNTLLTFANTHVHKVITLGADTSTSVAATASQTLTAPSAYLSDTIKGS